jgi:hypothetical protein
MSNADKNILITPNRGSTTADPKIDFVGANSTTAGQTITLNVLPTSNGTLSFEGSAGQLFSITNDLTGTIFSVNDVSGIPSIEVDADGTVKFAPFSGNVLMGSTSDTGAAKLQVTGAVTATGEVTAFYSDARLKDFEGAIDNALDKVKNLTGYYYTENETAKTLGYSNNKRQVGLSAQEVEKILPEVVAPAPIGQGYLTVKYEKLIPLLVEAIKEQQTMIEQLVKKINTLEERLNDK